MNNNIINKLNTLKSEEITWIIYLGIILLSFYSNRLERDYFINNNLESKEKYRNTMIIIFSILVIIYFYYFKNSCKDIQNLTINNDQKTINLTYLSSLASLLILISGLIYLYIILKDENINVEIAFN